MKTSIFIFFAFFFASVFHAQEKKWSIGLIGAPNFYNINSPKGFNHLYKSEIGFSLGFEFIHKLNKKLDLGFGLTASNLKYQAEYKFIFYDSLDPSIPRSSNIHLTYLNFPLFLRLKLASGDKTSFYSSFAIMSSIKISEDDKTIHEDNSIKSSNSVHSFLLGGKIGLGILYKLNEKLLIKLEPSLIVYINGFDSYMNYFPKIFQSTIGIEFKIGNRE